jgi:hypothetical protein
MADRPTESAAIESQPDLVGGTGASGAGQRALKGRLQFTVQMLENRLSFRAHNHTALNDTQR